MQSLRHYTPMESIKQFTLCAYNTQQVVILLFMYSISLCVLFSAYCIVLISFVLAMRKWCIPVLAAIQSRYLIIWWLLSAQCVSSIGQIIKSVCVSVSE